MKQKKKNEYIIFLAILNRAENTKEYIGKRFAEKLFTKFIYKGLILSLFGRAIAINWKGKAWEGNAKTKN